MNELSLFNSLFDDGFGFIPELYRTKTNFVPKVDVQESKETYLLTMELPGRSENDVDINVKDNVLTISSIKEEKKEDAQDKNAQKEKWLIRERHISQFTRSFTLPDDVNAEEISATFKNGLLNITLPRNVQKNEVKKITITAA